MVALDLPEFHLQNYFLIGYRSLTPLQIQPLAIKIQLPKTGTFFYTKAHIYSKAHAPPYGLSGTEVCT